MSWDLSLFGPEPGVSPESRLDSLAEDGTAPERLAIERAARIATRLEDELGFNPSEESKPESGEFVLARDDAIEVGLYPEEADLSVPYWDSLDPADVAQVIAAAAGLIASETGWQVFDPQLHRMAALFDAGEVTGSIVAAREAIPGKGAERRKGTMTGDCSKRSAGTGGKV